MMKYMKQKYYEIEDTTDIMGDTISNFKKDIIKTLGEKMKKLLLSILFIGISASAEMTQMTLNKIPGAGEHNNLVERICIDGYVFLNIYQQRPLMTIKYGNHSAMTAYPVLVSTTQFFTNVDGKLRAAQCFNVGKK